MEDRQELLEGLNDRQLLVGWFHASKGGYEEEYKEFEEELQKRGL